MRDLYLARGTASEHEDIKQSKLMMKPPVIYIPSMLTHVKFPSTLGYMK